MKRILATILLLITPLVHAEWTVPIVRDVPGGTYSVVVMLPDDHAHAFILDTGAGYTILAESTFEKIKDIEGVEKIRTVKGTTASGAMANVDLYWIPYLEFSAKCRVNGVYMGVIPGNELNLIGMNVFLAISPFRIDVVQQKLTGESCL